VNECKPLDPGGDWTTQAADPTLLFHSIGAAILKQRAGEGDREAQFSQGYRLVASEADMAAGAVTFGASGRSPRTDVGLLALCIDNFPNAHETERATLRRRRHPDSNWFTHPVRSQVNPRRRRAWR